MLRRIVFLLSILVLSALACNLPGGSAEPTPLPLPQAQQVIVITSTFTPGGQGDSAEADTPTLTLSETTLTPAGPTAVVVTPGQAAPTAIPVPTRTVIIPTAEPTGTPLPPDSTNTPAPTATATAKSGIQYVLRNNAVEYVEGTSCLQTVISGTVVTNGGDPIPNIPVKITGPDVNRTVLSGAFPEYGLAGWQVKVADQLVEATYYVQVINDALEGISERIVVITIPECQRNTARLVFEKLP